MALYYDAAAVLSRVDQTGSLKSSIYSASNVKIENASRVYALVSQTSKRDLFLKGVIENAELLQHEPKVRLCGLHFMLEV